MTNPGIEPAEVLAPLAEQMILADRYRIERFLEWKNGANVYRATDQATGLYVIIKEQPDRATPQSALNETDWAEQSWDNPWQNEFLILRSVSYPTVVKALDIFKHEDRAYLVIEQLEGRDLAYYIKKTPDISVQQTLDWMIQLCQSIGQLHRRQIVHLDLHPRSVVVGPDSNRGRLTGFHRATVLPCEGHPAATHGYSPPEQCGYLDMPVDERADIFALGMIWHYLLTGLDPRSYEGYDWHFQIREVSTFRPTINPQINRLINRMLAPDPNDRFTTINELKQHLLALVNNPARKVGHYSDVGVCRMGNEDSLSVYELNFTTQSQPSGLGLYVVADGMGGVNAGEYASAIAVDEISTHIQKTVASLNGQVDDIEKEIRAALQQSVKNANARIYETGRYNSELNGMGTTVTSALIYGKNLYVGHVGDSRGYLINKDGIEKITRDHSLVGRLVEIGQITPEEAAVHPQRNLIYRSLGTYPNVEVDLYQRPLKIGDWVLLCSDGLTGHVNDDELKSIVLASNEPHLAAQQLVNLANQRGGEDNITVVLVHLAEYN
ncbi:MAG: Stp1/IreP family PP2C-type Ser/Thr phosphatase [Bacteroidota bacterium]